MFRTATAQLREDAKRNPASSGRPVAELGGGTGAAVAGRGPYGGLGKARGGRRLGMGAGAGSVRGGFIPPFVRKGMEDGDGGGGGRGDAGAKGAGREGDGRLVRGGMEGWGVWMRAHEVRGLWTVVFAGLQPPSVTSSAPMPVSCASPINTCI